MSQRRSSGGAAASATGQVRLANGGVTVSNIGTEAQGVFISKAGGGGSHPNDQSNALIIMNTHKWGS